jgi:hypothetical protein
MLDDITLHWLTNASTSAARLYWENNANNFIAIPVSATRMNWSHLRG